MTQVHNNWKGLLTNASPLSIDAGYSVEQVNVRSAKNGVLEPRLGIVPMAGSAGTSAYHLSSTYFKTATDSYIVTHGTVYSDSLYTSNLWAYSLTSSVMGTILTAGVACNGHSPMSFARDRRGILYGVNGMGRGFRWNGLTSSVQWLGFDAPTSAPTIAAATTAGDMSEGDYLVHYRYVDSEGNYSSLSPAARISAASASAMLGTLAHSIQTDGRESYAQVLVSLADEEETLYLSSTVGLGSTTFAHTISDALLGTNASLAIYNANGSENANRFAPPPYTKPFIACFKDRMFYYGTVRYTNGTVGLIIASGTAVESSREIFKQTNFGNKHSASSPSHAGQARGGEFRFYVGGQSEGFQIDRDGNSFFVTLSSTNTGSISTPISNWSITPEPAEHRLLYWSEVDEPESVPATNAKPLQENSGEYDEPTGLMSFGHALWALHERHLYRVTFVSQPAVDMSVSPPVNRGCVNNRCWVVAEDHAYLLDQFGIYRIGDSGGMESISDPIQDKFRDRTVLDWNYSKWWHASYDPAQRLVRFFVTFSGDGHSEPASPKKCLAFSIEKRDWYMEEYVVPVTAPCIISLSNRTRLTVSTTQVGASTVGVSALVGESTSDITTSPVRGTVTAATSTTLSDTTLSQFTTAHVGAPITISSGTGAGQSRRILSRTSTQVTVDSAWTTTPDSTSKYVVGGFPWSLKTGSDYITRDNNQSERSVQVDFTPTTNDAELQVQVLYDHASVASTWGYTHNNTTGVKYAANNSMATVDMKKTMSGISDQTGWTQIPFPVPMTQNMPTNRSMAVRISGTGGIESQQVHTLLIEGVR